MDGSGKRNIANIITGARILGSVLLAFTPVRSVLFYAVYLLCGLSDMVDGTIARRTNCASPLGAKLDTIADFLFAAVSLAKLLPHIPVPGWLWIWIAGIALLKAANIGAGVVRNRSLVSVHSVMNKCTGLLLFLIPLTLGGIELKYSAGLVCAVATASALQEGYFIVTGRALVMQQERKKSNEIRDKAPFSAGNDARGS